MSRFNILTWGADDLPAVVCVHSAGGHARRFERLARMLDSHRRVVAYDLRGHGRSPWSGPQTMAQHVADLDHVIDAVGADQVTLVGHGLGGRVAVEYACEYGERVTAMALLDPLVITPATTLLLLAERERNRGTYLGVEDAIAAERSAAGLVHTPSALLEEEMAEHLVATEDGRYQSRYSREAAAAALTHAAESEPPELRAVVCPTLVIHGEESELVTEDEAEQIVEELRRGQLETVPGGHAVLWDALAETSALVREFVLTAAPA